MRGEKILGRKFYFCITIMKVFRGRGGAQEDAQVVLHAGRNLHVIVSCGHRVDERAHEGGTERDGTPERKE